MAVQDWLRLHRSRLRRTQCGWSAPIFSTGVERVEGLVVVTGNEHAVGQAQEPQEASLGAVEVLKLVDHQKGHRRRGVGMSSQVARNPQHAVGMRDRAVVLGQLERVPQDPI